MVIFLVLLTLSMLICTWLAYGKYCHWQDLKNGITGAEFSTSALEEETKKARNAFYLWLTIAGILTFGVIFVSFKLIKKRK